MESTKEKNGSSRKVIIGCIIAFGFLLVAGIVFFFCNRVYPVADTIYVELGENVSTDLSDYVFGMDHAIARSELDLSQVNQDSVGEYTALVTNGNQQVHIPVIIQDTTAPVLELKTELLYLQKGKEYQLDDLIEGVEDISGDVQVSVVPIKEMTIKENSHFYLFENGTFTIEVTATDASGNTTVGSVNALVDAEPLFSGVEEWYVAKGYEADFLQGITAEDKVDGDVTDAITVDLSTFDMNTAGTYEITYHVADSYGFTASVNTDVHVMEPMELQEAINTHVLNRELDNIEGVYNLYDAGYYEEDNIAFILEEMEPAIVKMAHDEGSYDVFIGHGFIMEITDEYVLICTNQHVVQDYEEVDSYFHNGQSATGQVIAVEPKTDVALVKIDRDVISEDLVKTLKAVHINEGYWEELDVKDDITIGIRTMNFDGSISDELTGLLLAKIADSKCIDFGYATEVSIKAYPGCSGSAIFDGHGNLMAMVRGFVCADLDDLDTYTYWGVSLPYILDFYEDTMGKPINYY